MNKKYIMRIIPTKLFFICLLLYFVSINENLKACTSFAVYSNSGTIYYGMNFDYQHVEMRFSIAENNDLKYFHLEFNSNGYFSSTVGMNSKGLFSSCQMLYPEVNEWHYPGEDTIHIGQLYYLSLTNTGSVDTIVEYLQITGMKVIHTYGLTLHDIFADTSGNAIVLEVGNPDPLITEIQNQFLVMTNFPNSDFEGQPYYEVTGVGTDRYKAAYEYIESNIEDFNYEDAFETLQRTVQSSGSFATQCSFVFDPLNLNIFIVIERNFDKIWKVDLENSTIETYSGFDSYHNLVIDSQGVLASDLETIFTKLNATYNTGKNAISFAYPNPFNNHLNIEFEIDVPGHVILDIYDLNGQKIQTLIDEHYNHGSHNCIWQPEKITPGVYFYNLITGVKTETGKIIFIENL